MTRRRDANRLRVIIDEATTSPVAELAAVFNGTPQHSYPPRSKAPPLLPVGSRGDWAEKAVGRRPTMAAASTIRRCPSWNGSQGRA